MAFIETAIESTMAKQVLRNRPQDEVEKSIVDRAEQMQKAVDLATDDYGGEIPDETYLQIFNDPNAYMKAASCEDCEDCAGEIEEVSAELEGEGVEPDAAKRRASAAARKAHSKH